MLTQVQLEVIAPDYDQMLINVYEEAGAFFHGHEFKLVGLTVDGFAKNFEGKVVAWKGIALCERIFDPEL